MLSSSNSCFCALPNLVFMSSSIRASSALIDDSLFLMIPYLTIEMFNATNTESIGCPSFIPNLIGKNAVIILIMIMLHSCLFSNPILIILFVIAFLLETHSIQSIRHSKSSRHNASNEALYNSTAPTLHEVCITTHLIYYFNYICSKSNHNDYVLFQHTMSKQLELSCFFK